MLRQLTIPSCVALLILCQPSATQAVSLLARTAADYVDRIGVATHLDFLAVQNELGQWVPGYYYDYENRIKPAIDYLGIKHIRDGARARSSSSNPSVYWDKVTDLYNDLGVQATIIVGSNRTEDINDLRDDLDIVRGLGGAVAAIEGPNETDVSAFGFEYYGQGFAEGTRHFMMDLHNELQSDPVLDPQGRDLPVLQTSVALTGNRRDKFDALGDLSDYADFANGHHYPGFGHHPQRGFDALDKWIDEPSPGLPKMSTEGGYHTGYRSSQGGTLTDEVHAKYVMRHILVHLNEGYQRVFLYQLMDTYVDDPDDGESNFGLFRAEANPTPKLAADGIHYLTTLLADDAPEGSWLPGALDFNVSTASTVQQTLIQKSTGEFLLFLWNEVDGWNESLGTALHVADVAGTLDLGDADMSVVAYLPLETGLAPTALTGSNGQYSLSIPDHPLILEISLNNPGDFNDDGQVNGADLLLWQQSVGTVGTLANSPFRGVVGQVELKLWKNNYDSNAPAATSGAIAVPEPSSMAVLVLASVFCSLIRRN